MKIGNGVVCVAVGLCLGAVILAAAPTRDDPARQTLLAMLASSDVIEANADPLTAIVEPASVLVPLATFKSRLGPMEKKIFQEKDGWGRDILYWSDGWNYMLLSKGADGIADIDYGADSPPYVNAPVGLTTTSSQDIIIVNGVIQVGPFLSRQAAPSSLAILRSIGTAVEEYAIDHNFYPSAGTPLTSVEALRSSLEPNYIRHLPLLDGWGKPVLYWSDVTHPVAYSYAVISVGADGIPDHSYETWSSDDFLRNSIGSFTDLRHDTIFMQGTFLQSPQQTLTPIDVARRSMADMRSIATACEEYAIDNNFYPVSAGAAPASSLGPYLMPWYIRLLPTTDGWNQPYLYYSNGSGYWIISTGSDRTADQPYQTWQLRDFENMPAATSPQLGKDIVFETGQFIQYPSFVQT